MCVLFHEDIEEILKMFLAVVLDDICKPLISYDVYGAAGKI